MFTGVYTGKAPAAFLYVTTAKRLQMSQGVLPQSRRGGGKPEGGGLGQSPRALGSHHRSQSDWLLNSTCLLLLLGLFLFGQDEEQAGNC